MKLFLLVLSLAALISGCAVNQTQPQPEVNKPTINLPSALGEIEATCSNLTNRDKRYAYTFKQRSGITVRLYSNAFLLTDNQSGLVKDIGRQVTMIKGCKIELNENYDALVTSL